MNVGYDANGVNEMHQKMAEIIGCSGELNHDLNKPVGRLRRYLDLHRRPN